jgi:hypothetical protein
VREHENRLRRALEHEISERIEAHRRRATDSVLSQDSYAQTIGRISELKALQSSIPDLCAKIIHDEEEDDDPPL